MRAWFDLSCGAAGDMLLGALLDAGAPLDKVEACVASLGVPVSLATCPVVKCGIAATQLVVHVEEDQPLHRTWYDVKALIGAAALPAPVRESALGVFAVLAEAEGLAHGTPADRVHFHEVGAHDAIADIVGVCAALHHLGVSAVAATPVALGGGTVWSAHGDSTYPCPPCGRSPPSAICRPRQVRSTSSCARRPGPRCSATGCPSGTQNHLQPWTSQPPASARAPAISPAGPMSSASC